MDAAIFLIGFLVCAALALIPASMEYRRANRAYAEALSITREYGDKLADAAKCEKEREELLDACMQARAYCNGPVIMTTTENREAAAKILNDAVAESEVGNG